MRTLQIRLRDSAWSVVYKALIVIHIMIREGDKDFTLKYIGERMPNLLSLDQSSISRSTGMTSDVKFILKYSKYLQTRVKQYHATKTDYVRDERSNNSTDQTGGRLRFLSVERGLLRESESVQKQIDSLLKNNFMENDVNNDVILTSFRLLVNDLLALFQELNEGVINLLEHYFEMSKVDAERALLIYKKYVDQTKYVVDYLRVAKHLEHSTKLHVPTIKHAPTALTSSLEEYLNDPNFEDNRRQYLLEKSLKKDASSPSKTPSILQRPPAQSQAPVQAIAQTQNGQANNGNGVGLQRSNTLIVQQSTFNPWEQQLQQVYHTGGVVSMAPIQQGQTFQPQQTFQAQPTFQPQQTFQPQPTFQAQPAFQAQPQVAQSNSPFAQTSGPSLNPAFTGNGFGGYGPQQTAQPQVQVQSTGNNPFLQSMATGNQVAPPQNQQPFVPQSIQTQPFAQQTQAQPFVQQPPQQFQPQYTQQTQPQPLHPQSTNPFASMTGNGRASFIARDHTANPFANSRFSGESNTTALTFGGSQQKQEPIRATATGSNPFKVSETTSSLFKQAENQHNQPAPLRPQATAGGLENLPSIPVFPETQREQQKQQTLNNAQMSLHAAAQQQQAGFQQQFQPQFTQQFTQQFPQQGSFPGQSMQQAQPIQQSVYANNTYNGPSLI
ncbi:hypothetical protein PSN45_001573 [Yamadazyma tenuis]|nr:hypothetical protein PSN45_001573 [Yamadazyma tenuis]